MNDGKKPKKLRHTVIISLSLKPEEHEATRKLAHQYGQSVSGLFRLLLHNQIENPRDLVIRPTQAREAVQPQAHVPTLGARGVPPWASKTSGQTQAKSEPQLEQPKVAKRLVKARKAEPRNERTTIVTSKSELAKINAAGEKLGMTFSEFGRRAMLAFAESLASEPTRKRNRSEKSEPGK